MTINWGPEQRIPLPKSLLKLELGAIIVAWLITDPELVAEGAAVAETPPIVSALAGAARTAKAKAIDWRCL